jgi:putative transposase
LGIEAFATLSNGTRIFHPGRYRYAERALKTAQRRVSRRKQGSDRRRNALTLLAKAHLKVKRHRADFHQKTALALVRENDTIYHEDVRTANMIKDHRLAKSISEAGWSAFLIILSFEAAYAGRSVVAAPPAYTSQMSSGRGVIVAKGLGTPVRTAVQVCAGITSRPGIERGLANAFGERLRKLPPGEPSISWL